jgi:2Fe-2S ferredoxin
MAKIKYIEHNGREHEIDVSSGLTVMEGAIKNNIPGIDADCGGACACATCHVYINQDWVEKLNPKEDTEEDMLDFAFDVKENSRLSCQISYNSSILDSFPKNLLINTAPLFDGENIAYPSFILVGFEFGPKR